MPAIWTALTTLLSFIAGLPAWILVICGVVFISAFDFGKDIFCWIFEESLIFIIYVLGSLDFNFAIFGGVNQYFAMLPQVVLDYLTFFNIQGNFALIVSALTIKFVMRLIPFVRLG